MSDAAESASPTFAPQPDGEHFDGLTGSELLVKRTVLGMSRSELGRALSVKENTVRRWESGKDSMPESIGAEIAAIESAADVAVNTLVEYLRSMKSPRVVMEMEMEHELAGAEGLGINGYGAGWWRSVVGRAMREVPGTRVGTVEEFASLNAG